MVPRPVVEKKVFKINRLNEWVPVKEGITFIGLENRTVKLQLNAEGMTSFMLIGLDLDAKPTGEEVFLGAFQGLDKIEFTCEGNFLVAVKPEKGKQVWYLDDRESVAQEAPDGTSFTRFEKRGMSAPDPLQLALHTQAVMNRLSNRDADRRTQHYIELLEQRLDAIEQGKRDDTTEVRTDDTSGNARERASAADDQQGADE